MQLDVRSLFAGRASYAMEFEKYAESTGASVARRDHQKMKINHHTY